MNYVSSALTMPTASAAVLYSPSKNDCEGARDRRRLMGLVVVFRSPFPIWRCTLNSRDNRFHIVCVFVVPCVRKIREVISFPFDVWMVLAVIILKQSRGHETCMWRCKCARYVVGLQTTTCAELLQKNGTYSIHTHTPYWLLAGIRIY